MVPTTVAELETTGGGTAITMVSEPVPVPPALLAPIVTEVDAAAVGVPLITPVELFRVSPEGSVPEAMAKLLGEFVPVIV